MFFIIWIYSSQNQETSSSKIFLKNEGDQFFETSKTGYPMT